MTKLGLRNWLIAVLCGGFFAFVTAYPALFVNRHDPVADAILDTAVAIVGTTVAFLGMGRFRNSGSADDLLIVGAILLLAWVHTFFDFLPSVVSPHLMSAALIDRVDFWGTNLTRVLAACYLILATTGIEKQSRSSPESSPITPLFAIPAVVGLATMAFFVWLVPVSHRDPFVGIPWRDAVSPLLQFVGAILLLVACARLTRESNRYSDAFKGWLASGCVFASFAMVASILFPKSSGEWIRPSDILRAAAIATWAWGAVGEVRGYWEKMSVAARREARRYVALDLHDGLAQELALLISSTYAQPEVRLTPEWHQQLRATAERALAETRRTITALVGDAPQSIEVDLLLTADHAAGVGVQVNVEVDATSDATFTESSQREALVRIVREAVSNAVRHGQAECVDISLSGTDGALNLRVSDDGLGFDPWVAETSGHYGLVSMRERAQSIGAVMAVRSAPGEGTTVEVQWPKR